jgi:serine O-acetyltransferase
MLSATTLQIELRDSSRADLLDYLTAQINNLYPDGKGDVRRTIDSDLDEALDRLRVCINSVVLWRENAFHYLHSEQNAVFLYYLANTIWRNRQDGNVCTKLFYLNKTLNGFQCFYDTPMPDRFFVGHSVGIVLVRTNYPEYFAIYQNCTVGLSHGKGPVLEEGIVMYPNSTIIGDCHVAPRTYLSQGCSLINMDTQNNAIVFTNGGVPTFKTPKHDILANIFRI